MSARASFEERTGWRGYRYERPAFGEYGSLLHEGERLVCHICGRSFRSLGSHVVKMHGFTAAEYKAEFGLMQSTPLWAERLSRNQSARAKEQDFASLSPALPPRHSSRGRTRTRQERIKRVTLQTNERSDVARLRMSARLKGKPKSSAHRAAITEAIRRAYAEGRIKKQPSDGKPKLTPEQRAEIRAAYIAGAETKPQLARRFGVAYTTISKVVAPPRPRA